MDRLKTIIREQLERFLMKEYAMSSKEYYERLDSILPPILDNLIAISIFADVNKDIVPHWANRAKQLPRRLFQSETKNKVEKATKNAFEHCFGVGYKDINDIPFQNIIDYYGNKKGHERMIARYSAEYYHKSFFVFIRDTLEILKQSLLTRDLGRWNKGVDYFVEVVNNF